MSKTRNKLLACLLAIVIVLPLVLAISACNKKTALDTPSGFRQENNILKWDEVENAVDYKVKVDGKNEASTNGRAQFSLADLDTGNYVITVMAVAAAGSKNSNSKWATTRRKVDAVKILLIDGTGQESVNMYDKLRNEMGKNVTIVSPASVPTQLSALNVYEEIIMMNVRRALLAEGFEPALFEYVKDSGGGLFVIGGDVAYDYEDLYGSTLATLMPVAAKKDYRPPSAAVLLLDNSDVMDVPLDFSQLDNPLFSGINTLWDLLTSSTVWSLLPILTAPGGIDMVESMLPESMSPKEKEDAITTMRALVDSLRDEDTLSIITMADSEPVTVLEKNPMTNMVMLGEAFKGLEKVPGSPDPNYTTAITNARELLTGSDAALRHIILMSDGNAQGENVFMATVKTCKEQGIKVSTIGVDNAATPGAHFDVLKRIAAEGGGDFFDATDTQSMSQGGGGGTGSGTGEESDDPMAIMQELLDILTGAKNVFDPPVYKPELMLTPNIIGITATSTFENMVFTAYNATALRSNGGDAKSVAVGLKGIYGMPLYAQWEYGNGRVGSFTCDLRGTADSGSKDFFDNNGINLISHIVNNLLKTQPAQAA